MMSKKEINASTLKSQIVYNKSSITFYYEKRLRSKMGNASIIGFLQQTKMKKDPLWSLFLKF